MDAFRAQSIRVRLHDRIVTGVGIQVDASRVADGVAVQEPAGLGVIVAEGAQARASVRENDAVDLR